MEWLIMAFVLLAVVGILLLVCGKKLYARYKEDREEEYGSGMSGSMLIGCGVLFIALGLFGVIIFLR